MILLGSGIDIVELARIKTIMDRHERRFAERILHPEELKELVAVNNTVAFIGRRFAVKEATAKALGLGIGEKLSFTDMYVEHDRLGKPLLGFTDQCVARLRLENTRSLLTIADERAYALAHVLLYAS